MVDLFADRNSSRDPKAFNPQYEYEAVLAYVRPDNQS